ncbi:putative disease resistance protein RGA3 [Bienertia sinuspersici]
MAELGLAVAQTLFSALQCAELKEICSIWGYKSQLEDLYKTVSAIKNVLKDAECILELSNKQRGYIEELKDVVYEADDLFDEFVTRLELKQLKRSPSKGGRFYEKETCSYVDVNDIIGRDDDKKAIIGKLLESKDQDVCFFTIVGVGGLGKTALAQLVYNDENIKQEFGGLMFWICVSDHEQQLDVKAIIRKILELVTKGQRSFDALQLEQLQLEFRNQLGGKKFLLVLDDVWNEDRKNWIDLQKLLMLGQVGGRVLITTRSERTATIIGNDEHTYRLQGLSPENSWVLFEMVAFTQRNDQQKELLEIGEKIVAKCYNVPLAIKVVGSLLYGQDISKWRSFENSGLAGIGKGDNEIMSVLKLSYHNLDSSLKSCFTYCAIFPKDYEIDKEMLINLWMAQGYIVSFDGGQSIDDAAKEHFLILLRRCFFQQVKKDKYGDVKSVKIHDLMHDVAQEVGGEEIRTVSSAENSFGDKVFHMSFTGEKCPEGLSIRTKLRSYIDLSLRKFIWDDTQVAPVNKFVNLRVLDLQHLKDINLVKSIGELLHLRYLDLSRNSFEALPDNSITKLHNLQTFILSYCIKLEELPHDLNKLEKLRHLDISHCPKLTCMPYGMNKLTSLRVLSKFVVGMRKQCNAKLKDLESLTNLTSHIFIYIGENYNGVDTINDSYLSQLKHLNEVQIEFGYREDVEDEAVLEKLEPHPNLRGLHLESYNGITIPWWRTAENNGVIPYNLVNIHINDCENLQEIPSFSKLPYLKSLILDGLYSLKCMEKTRSTSSYAEAKETTFFPSLESLEIRGLLKLERWFTAEGSSADTTDHCLSRIFPRLSQLEISAADKLVSFAYCPSLKTLECQRSRILMEVVGRGNHSSCLTTLSIYCDRELKSLSEIKNVFMVCASSLRSLTIHHCHNLSDISEGLEHLTVLKSLNLSYNDELNLSEDDTMPWRSLPQSLHILELSNLKGLTSLPKGMQYLTSLLSLDLMNCNNLKDIPEWISCLSSLNCLYIEGSRMLIERCSDPNGPDWHKIQHIPNIDIYY